MKGAHVAASGLSMTSFKPLLIAIAASTFLALSGCASDSDDTNTSGSTETTSMTTGTGSMTGGPGGNQTTGNGTLEERTCTATVGGPGSGWVGAPGGAAYVGGCPFGDAVTTAVVLAVVELPAECDAYHNAPNAGVGEAQPASQGTEYPSGTSFSMFCGAGSNLVGKISLQAVA